MIVYYPHKDIDKKKWDDCIEQSVNELIYAYSWYLDVVVPGWDALVLDDYEAVMPLTWRQRTGIRYLFPPLYTKQLGIFSKRVPSKETTIRFLDSLTDRFKFIQIHLNEYNHIDTKSRYYFRMNNNFEIDLTPSYEKLYEHYNRNCRRNIKKAKKCSLVIRQDITAHSFTNFIKSNLEDRLKQLGKKDYHLLITLIEKLITKQAAELYGSYLTDGTLCGVALFLITAHRCIFLVCASSEQGKQCQTMYLLVDHQIKKYAGSGKIFDFSGSNIPGIAYFNSTFGAYVKKYPTVVINNLPWPLRLLKRQD